jgi:type II secretory pathway pseudopilin PulG
VPRGNSRAFHLVELLVAIGVVCLLLSLALPLLGSTKGAALATRNREHMRQMASGLAHYAAGSRDLPPVFGAPAWPGATPWRFDFGEVGTGAWIEHNWLYSLAITAELEEPSVANAAGKQSPFRVREHGGQRVCPSDFVLTNTLYAMPSFFAWETQSGPAQFRAQALTSIQFPSAKGVLSQGIMYHYPRYGPQPACCVYDLPSPVAFADLSVQDLVLRRLPTGIFNIYDVNILRPGGRPQDAPGRPVVDTMRGIAGRDR